MPAFQAPVGIKRKSDQYDEPSRKRLAVDSSSPQITPDLAGGEEYWMVLWRNPQYKKHKTWDGDAILVANAAKATLHDMDRKVIAVGKAEWPLYEGRTFNVSSKEIELERPLKKSEYLSGQCFGASNCTTSFTPTTCNEAGLSRQFVPLNINYPLAPLPAVPEGEQVIPVQPGDILPVSQNSFQRKEHQGSPNGGSHWTANWRKQQIKKHKTWDGDAYVSVFGEKLIMVSEEGKFMGSAPWKGDRLYAGYCFRIGDKEVELDSRVDLSHLPSSMETSQPRDIENGISQLASPQLRPLGQMGVEQDMPRTTSSLKFVAPASFYGAGRSKPKGPLHDPAVEDAVLMKAPTKDHVTRYNKQNLPIVPVVLDPILSRRMRPHQKEGVKFLYECVMGFRKHEGQGCILADEMGLGKTLQTISLVWTLLKQNPYASPRPVVKKVLIVCPVSLVNNWKAEFHKWLGRDRIGVAACDKDKKTALTFMNAKNQHVLIIGYERLRTVIDDLSSMIPPFGLIICDEGHRLKSANNKTSLMFHAFKTLRRIILSGTPIQNDLGEFHAMADFCNPGLLDEYSTFRRVYEVPILKSRAPDTSLKDKELGEARTAQLLSIAKSFVLRRDATLLENYLPPKHEYIVFVTPTSLQLAIFSKILHPDKLDDLAQSSAAESLALINTLTKVSNSPILLKATADKAKVGSNDRGNTLQLACLHDALKLLPERVQIDDVSLSGKLIALSKLLQVVWRSTEEKCVVVSHYTSTLNILEAYCKKQHYSYYRLDGQTPAAKRQEYVSSFNKSSRKASFIFLLSSKAGGMGINLIGASRLCLVDSDWNPSHDLQSMARCHRDGQKHPVYIYRFLTAGTIDEKIFQRQVTKLGLSNSLIGTGTTSSKSDSFSRRDLRDIFRIHPDTLCNTHDLLECPCEQRGAQVLPDTGFLIEEEQCSSEHQSFVKACDVKPDHDMDKVYMQKKKAGLAALGEWGHINCLQASAMDHIQDDVLRKFMVTCKPTVKKDTSDQALTQLDQLFTVDLEGIEAEDDALTVKEVPGGSVSFVFQKNSSALELPSRVTAETEDSA